LNIRGLAIGLAAAIGLPGSAASLELHGTRDLACAFAADTLWVAWVETADSSHVVFAGCDVNDAGLSLTLHRDLFDGEAPRLAACGDGAVLLVTRDASPGDARFVARKRAPGSGSWSAPAAIDAAAGTTLGFPGTLVDGSVVLPVVRSHGKNQEIVLLHTRDGKRWESRGKLRADGAQAAAIARLPDDDLQICFRRDGSLVTSLSSNAGRSWKEPERLEWTTRASAHAIAPAPGGIALAWCESAPAQGCVPALRPVRLSIESADRSWVERFPLALWPGHVPEEVRLAALPGARWAVVVRETDPAHPTPLWSLRIDSLAAVPPSRYCNDPAAARRALEVLCAHASERPARVPQLFIEGYTMRALVAADALADLHFRTGREGERPRRNDPIAWADSLALRQNDCGYWPLGYGEGWTADMAAALGLFVALEPYVDATRLQRYEATVDRFLAALERDHFFLQNGAISLGWPEGNVCGAGVAAFRSDIGSAHDPYLVSTALAGMVLPAWRFHRTADAKHAARARAAVDFSLGQMRADGSLPGLGQREGPWLTAAYVQQGWMAADSLLRDPTFHARLASALVKHVDWLIATQRPDGTWGDPQTGENARTPSIIDFLIWYDQKCERRDDVAAAIRRATAPLVDAGGWQRRGIARAGILGDMLRAFGARSLAAVVGERPVL
jgi:hypothetical protein